MPTIKTEGGYVNCHSWIVLVCYLASSQVTSHRPYTDQNSLGNIDLQIIASPASSSLNVTPPQGDSAYTAALISGGCRLDKGGHHLHLAPRSFAQSKMRLCTLERRIFKYASKLAGEAGRPQMCVNYHVQHVCDVYACWTILSETDSSSIPVLQH
jgi:hypothetical protein